MERKNNMTNYNEVYSIGDIRMVLIDGKPYRLVPIVADGSIASHEDAPARPAKKTGGAGGRKVMHCKICGEPGKSTTHPDHGKKA